MNRVCSVLLGRGLNDLLAGVEEAEILKLCHWVVPIVLGYNCTKNRYYLLYRKSFFSWIYLFWIESTEWDSNKGGHGHWHCSKCRSSSFCITGRMWSKGIQCHWESTRYTIYDYLLKELCLCKIEHQIAWSVFLHWKLWKRCWAVIGKLATTNEKFRKDNSVGLKAKTHSLINYFISLFTEKIWHALAVSNATAHTSQANALIIILICMVAVSCCKHLCAR